LLHLLAIKHVCVFTQPIFTTSVREIKVLMRVRA
jgi:hypothetical protein